MPFNSFHGLGSGFAPSGLIYLAGSEDSSGVTRAFVFNTTAETFSELPNINEEKRYMSCGIAPADGGSERFYVIGGGM